MGFPATAFPNAFDGAVTEDIYNSFAGGTLYYQQYFNIKPSTKGSEKLAAFGSFGAMPTKPQGQAYPVDVISERWTFTITHGSYGMAFPISQEMVDDDERGVISDLAKEIGSSAVETLNVTHANILNYSFTATVVYGDGEEIVMNAHPTAGGTTSNVLATAADLAYASLEIAENMLLTTVDNRGKTMPITAAKIVGSGLLKTTMAQITSSMYTSAALQNNTYTNLGFAFDPYITDTDAWWLIGDGQRNGLISYVRTPFEAGTYMDNASRSLVHYGYMRFSASCRDWRGIVGTPGA